MSVGMRGDGAPSTIGGDALVVTAFRGELGPAAVALDGALHGELTAMVSSGEIGGSFGELTVLHSTGDIEARRVAVLGLGERRVLDSFRLHNAYTLAARQLRRRRLTRLVLAVDSTLADGAVPDLAALLRAMVTGSLVANHDAGVHKSDSEDSMPPIDEIVLAGIDGDVGDIVEGALADGVLLAESTLRVQRWVSEPSNSMTPTLLADSVKELCSDTTLTVEVMDRAALQAAGAGALLGIAQGSDEPPTMIVVRHQGGGSGPLLALVGKGITFDTGGISIKPALGMEAMKGDMGGGAAVLCALHAIAALGVRCNVVGIVPATENMPGGRALKPGDVIRAMDGTTIEVVNTDAEGRVVLADGLALARRLGATHIVDVATLTGAVIVALGHACAGLMSSDPELTRLVQRAACEGGDRFAELPLYPEYDTCLRSDVADVRNWGGREAGPIGAAVFIRAFAGGLPWAHLDIAGTSWNDQASLKDVPSGPTGAPVRTLVWLARLFARG